MRQLEERCSHPIRSGGSSAQPARMLGAFLDSPAQVDGRRAHGGDLRAALLEGSIEEPVVGRPLAQRPQSHGVCAGVANGRGTAYAERCNRIADLLRSCASQIARLMRQLALVEELQATLLSVPVHGRRQVLEHVLSSHVV